MISIAFIYGCSKVCCLLNETKIPTVSHVKQEILDHEISPSYKHVMGPFESTFKTFAANGGYPSLGSYDVGKQIVDLNFCRFVSRPTPS